MVQNVSVGIKAADEFLKTRLNDRSIKFQTPMKKMNLKVYFDLNLFSVTCFNVYMFEVYLCCSTDATNNACIGHYMNDVSMRHMECNCLSKVCYVNKKPCLLVFAARDIQEGEELHYDYGTGNLPWQNKNPDSATVVTSASDQMMSEKLKKQQSVSVESPVASTAE